MPARLKSSVLRREERGFGSISMGRLIISGMIGGVVFMLMRVLGLGVLMIPGGLAGFITALILSSPRHGIPLYRHLIMTTKARLMLTENSPLAKTFNLTADDLILDSSALFSVVVVEEEVALDGWEIVADSEALAGIEIFTDTIEVN
jgi:hypothetical protein